MPHRTAPQRGTHCTALPCLHDAQIHSAAQHSTALQEDGPGTGETVSPNLQLQAGTKGINKRRSERLRTRWQLASCPHGRSPQTRRLHPCQASRHLRPKRGACTRKGFRQEKRVVLGGRDPRQPIGRGPYEWTRTWLLMLPPVGPDACPPPPPRGGDGGGVIW